MKDILVKFTENDYFDRVFGREIYKDLSHIYINNIKIENSLVKDNKPLNDLLKRSERNATAFEDLCGRTLYIPAEHFKLYTGHDDNNILLMPILNEIVGMLDIRKSTWLNNFFLRNFIMEDLQSYSYNILDMFVNFINDRFTSTEISQSNTLINLAEAMFSEGIPSEAISSKFFYNPLIHGRIGVKWSNIRTVADAKAGNHDLMGTRTFDNLYKKVTFMNSHPVFYNDLEMFSVRQSDRNYYGGNTNSNNITFIENTFKNYGKYVDVPTLSNSSNLAFSRYFDDDIINPIFTPVIDIETINGIIMSMELFGDQSDRRVVINRDSIKIYYYPQHVNYNSSLQKFFVERQLASLRDAGFIVVRVELSNLVERRKYNYSHSISRDFNDLPKVATNYKGGVISGIQVAKVLKDAIKSSSDLVISDESDVEFSGDEMINIITRFGEGHIPLIT